MGRGIKKLNNEKNGNKRGKKKGKNNEKTSKDDKAKEFNEEIEEESVSDIIFDYDEFSKGFKQNIKPKIAIYLSMCKGKRTKLFAKELEKLFDNSKIYSPNNKIKRLIDLKSYLINENYTGIIIITEFNKKPHGLAIINLPSGIAANYRITSIEFSEEIPNHGKKTNHAPELMFLNFNNRLGEIVMRFFNSLFPRIPDLKGRQVVAFLNRKDFIFFRMYRYKFLSNEEAITQELGPRFTLRLNSVQDDVFSLSPNYIWIRKKETNKKKEYFL